MPCGRPASTSLLVIALFCAVVCPDVCWPQSESLYRASADEVRVTFSAIDQDNRGILALEKTDFAIVDNGIVVRDFQSFTHEEWASLELAILIDASDSVHPEFRHEINDYLEEIAHNTQVDDENLSLFSFRDSQPVMLCIGSCRPFQAPEVEPRRNGRGGKLTPLFDTVVYASQFLARQGDASTRRVLVVFSDGQDTISRNSLSNAIDSAISANVQVYCIGASPSLPMQGTAVLRALAAGTGGRVFSFAEGALQAGEFILESSHATYAVTYRLPSRDAGFHQVRVLPTHNPNLKFISRNGYSIPDSTDSQGER